MRILFVWTGVTSYMADCWRALRRRSGIELKIVIDDVGSGRAFDKAETLRDLDWSLSPPPDWVPDVAFLVGWRSKMVRSLVDRPDWRRVRKVFCMDMPWRWQLRCLVAPVFLRGYARKFASAFVPGEASARYARWIGFRRVEKGLFSIDMDRFAPSGAEPSLGFLYIGRFSGEKRLDILIDGYRRYREKGGRLGLDLYGEGSDLPDCSADGISVHPFVQPSGVPELYRSHRALVLASDFDPWPLVVLEARASGCPAIVTDRCTNHREIIRSRTDGTVCPARDAEAISEAMLGYDRRPVQRTVDSFIRRWDVSSWCDRVMGDVLCSQ